MAKVPISRDDLRKRLHAFLGNALREGARLAHLDVIAPPGPAENWSVVFRTTAWGLPVGDAAAEGKKACAIVDRFVAAYRLAD